MHAHNIAIQNGIDIKMDLSLKDFIFTSHFYFVKASLCKNKGQASYSVHKAEVYLYLLIYTRK